MPIFILLYTPKKSAQKNGAVPLAIALDEKNKKLAEIGATWQLEKEFPGSSDNFFKPEITEDVVGSPRPPVGVFDEKFPQENELIDGVWHRKEAKTQTNPNDLVDFSALALNEKADALVLYGQYEINEHEHSMICDFLADDDQDPDSATIIDALSQNAALARMYPQSLLELVQAIHKQFPAPSESPQRVIKFVDDWVNKPYDRPKQTAVNNAPAANDSPSEIAGLDHERPYPHTYRTLNREVAIALANDIDDPWSVSKEQTDKGDKLIQADDEAYKRWSTQLSIVEKVLTIPRPVIFALIAEAKKHPSLATDPNGRKRFVDEFLTAWRATQPEPETPAPETSSVQVSNLGEGRFSVDGLVSSAPSNQGEKAEMHEAATAETNAQQAKEALNQMGYGVYATEPEAPAPAPADDFQSRAAAVESEIAEKPVDEQENLSIWKRVQRTDPRYTKPLTGTGFEGTSINSEYMIMRATEIFGPAGSGWGYRVLEEKMIPGAPLSETLYDDNKKFIGVKLLRDADGSLISELNHSLKIAFWYLNDESERSEIEAYGATPYMYKTKNGIKTDSEVIKKSLTDAIKKALSLLGFSADVWLGMHDNPEYVAENEIEFKIKNASDKAEDTVRLRTELDEKFTKNAATLEGAVSVNEVNKIFGTVARELEVHRKSAEAKGDNEYTKYLAGRLRRLNQIKDERIAALKTNEGALLNK